MKRADLYAKEAMLIARKLRLASQRRSTEAVQREHERLKVRILRKELRELKRSAA
jgi:hypothetical protein